MLILAYIQFKLRKVYWISFTLILVWRYFRGIDKRSRSTFSHFHLSFKIISYLLFPIHFPNQVNYHFMRLNFLTQNNRVKGISHKLIFFITLFIYIILETYMISVSVIWWSSFLRGLYLAILYCLQILKFRRFDKTIPLLWIFQHLMLFKLLLFLL